ncbi:MAG TPA: alpha-L-arabinofuranosidase C-terminal domain-containing protein [Opitutus sp.]|nr:alpha-L-arabinofuranosidase C-terminal domain-containing protein [Opitutus sp.]
MNSPALLRRVLCLLVLPAALFGANPVAVKIDTTKTGAPINPFIYGQFIEHLGRCIYGGIWAEMLEDRKFYFPITAEYAPYRSLQDTDFPVVGASPWQIIGEPAGVKMVTDGAFVGDHSPRLGAGVGIRQLDLGVVAEKSYVGYVWAKPVGGAAKIEVSLVWGPGADERATRSFNFRGNDFSKQTFAFKAKGSSEKNASFEIRVISGEVVLGPPSIMPSDNVRGMRRDTLGLLKQLNGSIYRWPGGNFVSGYDWRDGIGDRDRRPPRKNPAWTGVEHNDFGTDEFIAFCREINTVPVIAANTGFGDAHSAAQWVEYCNSPASTLAGGWRAKNGSEKPFDVKYWCVGNEMWGTFQLGWMQLHHYTIKHNMVATAMRKVDPSLSLVAVGDLETVNRQHDPEAAKANLPWSKGMLQSCADYMDLISEHFYSGRVPYGTAGRVGLTEHVGQVKAMIRTKAMGHRELQPTLPNLKGRTIPISMDEWNYWHREYVYGELGCIYELQDGLGIAAGLHEYYRQSDIIPMAFYAQTVNVIGAIKTTRTTAEMETTGLVLQLYRERFGQTPLQLAEAPGPYDVVAALTKDGRTLTVGVVNPTKEEIELVLDLSGSNFSGTGTRWHITGADEFAHNAPGKPRAVDIQKTDGVAANTLRVPALSATLFALPLK